MGIRYVGRGFELRELSGFGGSPRRDLIGGVLSGSQETPIDSDAINPAGVQDSFFSRLPLAGAVVDPGRGD